MPSCHEPAADAAASRPPRHCFLIHAGMPAAESQSHQPLAAQKTQTPSQRLNAISAGWHGDCSATPVYFSRYFAVFSPAATASRIITAQTSGCCSMQRQRRLQRQRNAVVAVAGSPLPPPLLTFFFSSSPPPPPQCSSPDGRQSCMAGRGTARGWLHAVFQRCILG